ncbi:MAG: hypothetical protein ACOYVK_19760 [Bacillota bacterium]
MPTISKLRIVNFKFEGGVNTLRNDAFNFKNTTSVVNLINGGGKTSLIHFILQVIKPEVSIAKRKIKNYFNKDNTAHAIIEWNIDDRKLVTGIVMRKSTVAVSGVEYFTYIFEYTDRGYTIETLPILENGKVIEFNDLKPIFKNLHIPIYTDDYKYRKMLEDYGIFKDEWEFVFSLNQDEGDIDTLFKNCSTTRKVLEKWIIPNISNEAKEDTQIFISNIEKNIDNFYKLANDIANVERYKTFLVDMNQLIESVNKCEETEVCYNKALTEISAFKKTVDDLYKNIDKIVADKDHELEEVNQEIAIIHFKINSFEYSKKKHKLDQMNNDLSSLIEIIKGISEAIAKLEYQRKLYEGASLYTSVTYYKNQIIKLETELQALRLKNEEVSTLLNQVKYSIKVMYQDQLKKDEDKLTYENDRFVKICEEIAAKNEAKNETSNEINEIQKRIDEHSRKIDGFNKFQNEVRNNIMTKYPNPVMLIEKNHLEYFKSLRNEMQDQYTNNSNEMDRLEEENVRINNDLENIHNRILQLKEEQINIENAIGRYSDDLLKVLKHIGRYGYDEKTLFESSIVESLKLQKNSLQLDKQQIDKQLIKTREQIKSIERGAFNTSEQLLDVLKENEIEYQLGLNWLKLQEKNSRERYMQLNPLIPYSVIIPEKYMKVIRTINFDSVDSLCSIVIKENLTTESIGDIEKSLIKVNHSNYFILPFYNDVIVDNDQFNSFRERLRENAIRLEKDSNDLESEIDGRKKAIDVLLAFTEQYNKDSLPSLIEKRDQIMDKTAKEDALKNVLITNGEENTKLVKSLRKKNDEIKEVISEISDDIQKLENYFVLEVEFNNHSDLKGRLGTEKKERNNYLNQLSEQLSQLQAEKETSLVNRTKIENEIERIEGELTQYISIKETEVLADDIQDLKAKEKGLENQLNREGLGNIKNIEDDIANYTTQMNRELDAIKELEVPLEEIRAITYDVNIYIRVKDDLKKLRETLEKRNEESTEKKIQLETFRKEVNDDYEKILNNPPYKEPIIFEDVDEDKKNRFLRDLGDYNKWKEQLDEAIATLKKDKNDLDIIKNRCDDRIKDRGINLIQVDKTLPINKITELRDKLEDVLVKHKESLNESSNAKTMTKERVHILYDKYSNPWLKGVAEFLLGLKDNEFRLFEYGNMKYLLDINKDHIQSQIEIIDKSITEVQKEKNNIVNIILQKINVLISDLNEFDSKSKISIQDNYSPKMIQLMIPSIMEEKKKDLIVKYLDDIVSEIVFLRENEENIDLKRIRQCLNDKFSINSLLNVVTPLDDYILKVYKPKETKQFSGWVKWEDVESETSGGEGSAALLFLFITIMTFKRYKTLIQKRQIGSFNNFFNMPKVLIMDNPFGDMSSGHLIKPVLALAEKYNVQLICFTAITDRSVIDQFELVYTMQTKYSLDGQTKVLEVEKTRDTYYNQEEKELQTIMFEMLN